MLVLAATGYLLDQSPQLQDLEEQSLQVRALGGVPPLGPFRTFRLPIVDRAGLTGLHLPAAAGR